MADVTPEGIEQAEPKLTDSRILFNLVKLLEQGSFQLQAMQYVAEAYQVILKEYNDHPEIIEAKKKEEAKEEENKTSKK